MPRDWNADAYDRLSEPQRRWGAVVVSRLDLAGTERVLDAGCGTGRVTELLRERLPDGEIVALDASPSMVARARERLGEDRMTYAVADLMDPLPVEPVDAIVSTATFHWVPDHERLFANLAVVLRPGGRLEAQCGGAGNVENLAAVVEALGRDANAGKVYAGPAETAARLERAGFVDVRCWLTPEPTPIPREDLPAFLQTVCLGGLLEDRPADERERFAREVAARMPESRLDYVRLNLSARRAGGAATLR
ncbi:MAG TPA: methyltransferase domain-containing protein [Actinomycetota bacterium]|nr:methyltransferase domain-containing protein [Actinomycetota bacterium]